MTDVVTFRPKRPKRELQQAFGNLSEKLNELIEREIGCRRAADWRIVLERDRPEISDADYDRCLQPK